MAVTTLNPEAPAGAFFAPEIADINYRIASARSRFVELFNATELFCNIYQEVIDDNSANIAQHYVTDDGSTINADTDSDILEYYREKHGYTPLVFPGPQVDHVRTYDFVFQHDGDGPIWQTTDTETKTGVVTITQASFSDPGWLVAKSRMFDGQGNQTSEKELALQEIEEWSRQFIQVVCHSSTKEKAAYLFEARKKFEEEIAVVALFKQVEVMIDKRPVSVSVNHDLAQKKIGKLEEAKEKIIFKPAEIRDFSERYTQLRFPIVAAFG